MEFEAEHALRSVASLPGPEAPHRHRFRVEVALETDRLDAHDIAVDFVPARELVGSLAHRLEGKSVNDVPPFDRISPTTENIARWFAAEIEASAARRSLGGRLREVTVWEGPEASVTLELPAAPRRGTKR